MSSSSRRFHPRLAAMPIVIMVFVAAGTMFAVLAPRPAQAATTTCYPSWSATVAYLKSGAVSRAGHNFQAKWWTKNEDPVVNTSGVWTYLGDCGLPSAAPSGPRCSTATPWVASKAYAQGALVSYSDGKYYLAAYANPGYNPTTATWFWHPYQCPSELLFSAEQFQLMFPLRNPLYTYQDLAQVITQFPAFTRTGSDTIRRQETAAFLANVTRETGGLHAVVEGNPANYSHYCATSAPYGCPAGQSAYYGRGPLQLTWNVNYKVAGDALGLDLLHNPGLVAQDGKVAWRTAVWYWMTMRGIAPQTAHDAMVTGTGFGATIRAINGAAECGGVRPASVQSRIDSYLTFASILGVPPGGNLSC